MIRRGCAAIRRSFHSWPATCSGAVRRPPQGDALTPVALDGRADGAGSLRRAFGVGGEVLATPGAGLHCSASPDHRPGLALATLAAPSAVALGTSHSSHSRLIDYRDPRRWAACWKHFPGAWCWPRLAATCMPSRLQCAGAPAGPWLRSGRQSPFRQMWAHGELLSISVTGTRVASALMLAKTGQGRPSLSSRIPGGEQDCTDCTVTARPPDHREQRPTGWGCCERCDEVRFRRLRALSPEPGKSR